jgi:hypothetical protein
LVPFALVDSRPMPAFGADARRAVSKSLDGAFLFVLEAVERTD